MDLYNLNDIEASEQKTRLEVLLLHDRFTCREEKADVSLNFQLTFIHIYANIDISISISAFDFAIQGLIFLKFFATSRSTSSNNCDQLLEVIAPTHICLCATALL